MTKNKDQAAIDAAAAAAADRLLQDYTSALVKGISNARAEAEATGMTVDIEDHIAALAVALPQYLFHEITKLVAHTRTKVSAEEVAALGTDHFDDREHEELHLLLAKMIEVQTNVMGSLLAPSCEAYHKRRAKHAQPGTGATEALLSLAALILNKKNMH